MIKLSSLVCVCVQIFFAVPVAVVEDPVDTIHFAGGSINLTCTVFGVPYPVVVWFKDDMLFSEDDRISISNITLSQSPNEIIDQSILSFTDLELSDDADYFCQGSNPGAFDAIFVVNSARAHLTVQC